jgi:hypothetical protein
MVLLASSYDQSRFFRAEDLQEEKLLKIKEATEEMVGDGADQEKKLVVWFTNSKKGLPLNRTNNRTIRGAYGDDTGGWPGKIIALFPTQAPFRGRMVGAVRVRIPPKANPRVTTGPQQTPKSPPPKAVTKAAAKKSAPAPEPEPEMEDEDLDFDDETGI